MKIFNILFAEKQGFIFLKENFLAIHGPKCRGVIFYFFSVFPSKKYFFYNDFFCRNKLQTPKSLIKPPLPRESSRVVK